MNENLPRPAAGGGPTGPEIWNQRYLAGDTPWDSGGPSHNLKRVLALWKIQPCAALEMGCGSGNDALYLASLGFEVTAFDLALRAIEVAGERARLAGLQARFLAVGMEAFEDQNAQFGFVFDNGFYHCLWGGGAEKVPEFVASVLAPGGLWLSVLGNANEPEARPKGPPRIQASELCRATERHFAMVELRESYLESADKSSGWRPLAWSALLRRR